MSSLFKRSDFGPGRAMTGADLNREVHLSSDLDDNQGPRTMEYYQIAQMLAPMAEAMKALAANTTHAARLAGNRRADGYAHAAEKALSKARRAMIKAQSDDEEDRDGETDEELLAEVDRCLARAKKLLLQAHEADEPEADVDDVAAGIRKARLTRAGMIARPTPAAVAASAATAKAAVTDAAMAKATAQLNAQADRMQHDLASVVALLHTRTGVTHAPMSHIAKAANDPLPSLRDIEGAIEGGVLERTHGGDARMIRNIALQGDVIAARTRRDASKSTGIHTLFAGI
jgi:hypothetical protein